MERIGLPESRHKLPHRAPAAVASVFIWDENGLRAVARKRCSSAHENAERPGRRHPGCGQWPRPGWFRQLEEKQLVRLTIPNLHSTDEGPSSAGTPVKRKNGARGLSR